MPRRAHLFLLRTFRRLPRAARRFAVRRLYPSFTVGSMAIIEGPGDTLLFVRHSYRRRWGVPGGLLARGELPMAAARREVLEEVALDIETIGEPTVVVDAHVRRVDIVFRARPISDAAIARIRPSSPEIVETRWFPRHELPEMQHETAAALACLARLASERS
jgi:ADP-ribose pyrophosphatase YjhB (NUDIX family)